MIQPLTAVNAKQNEPDAIFSSDVPWLIRKGLQAALQ